ncbi:tRNA (guanosine(46)-N7)-methyltransferase TrmB [Geothermobacter hydrogeniphilus]|uniref:tRNA (guanine-N(7)-)-methyltransferase n=1 Tax=Geothermobacter hydrogeniphilus TaxID=1969733 RepID=A0A2K2H610_9BACT|nr:tRNA (guanosine(46)-N7)-methyltransferase TrmB [Geothermobacter hydrogeniphilus]PNU18679.1 tRNA (guanosine(46)-N7)-methyltransferase TrmB [Geothermobacter hydrogeniphilus]
MTQRIIPIESAVFLREEQWPTAGIDAAFPRKQPLWLEIGCGIGDFIIQLAARHPDRNYLAIDIYNKGCLKTCRRVEQNRLDNVRVMRAEARYLLDRFIPPQSLSGVIINCPDPWPKKRHRGRRLVNNHFLELLRCYLAPGGEFFFATDFADYAEMVADIIPAVAGYENLQAAVYSTDLGDYPISKYMRRFLEMGQPIYLFHYRRAAQLAPELLQPPEFEKGFRLRWLAHG